MEKDSKPAPRGFWDIRTGASAALLILSLVALASPAFWGMLDASSGREGFRTFGSAYGLVASESLSTPRRLAVASLVGSGLTGLLVCCLRWWGSAVRGRLGKEGVWSAAGVIAFVALSLPPGLSDDVLTYAARGEMIVGQGVNPYHFTPAQMDDWEVNPILRADAWPHVHLVYGFVWAWVTAGVRWAAGEHFLNTLMLYKLIGLLGHFALLGAIWIMWPRNDLRGRVVTLALVGLNPTVALESIGMAHTEGLMMGLWGVSMLLLTRGWLFASGALLALAIEIKYVPLIAVPFLALWLLRSERGTRGLAVWVFGMLVGLIVPALGFDPLQRATWLGVEGQFRRFGGGAPEAVIALLINAATDSPRAWPVVAWSLRGIGLAVFGVTLFKAVRTRTQEPPWALMALAVFVLTLTASSFLAPWYSLWALPWAVLGRREAPRLCAGVVAFSVAMPFTLLVPILTGNYGAPIQCAMLLIWAVPTLLAAVLWKPRRAISVVTE